MSILYSDNFKFSNGELKKFPEFADSSISHRNHGHGNEASSLEVESMLERFMSSCNRANDSGSQSLGGFAECFVKQETTESEFCNGSSSLFRNQEVCSLPDHNSASAEVGNPIANSFSFINSVGTETPQSSARNFSNLARQSSFINSMEIENSQSSARNFSNLARQSSCPAEFSNILAVENGFGRTTNLRSFGTRNVNANDPFNFSNDLPLSSKRMREISGGNVVLDSSNGHNLRNYSNLHRVTSLPDNSWDESALRSLKRARDNNGLAFSNSNPLENKTNTETPSSVYGLTHHLSLAKTFSEMATKEKFLQFQDAVPCKIRAKRGCATHPRSIAERVRRTRISERMRKLQDLFPNMDKQTSIADMLDWAVGHIKDLQKQVQTLSVSKAKCSCLT